MALSLAMLNASKDLSFKETFPLSSISKIIFALKLNFGILVSFIFLSHFNLFICRRLATFHIPIPLRIYRPSIVTKLEQNNPIALANLLALRTTMRFLTLETHLIRGQQLPHHDRHVPKSRLIFRMFQRAYNQCM